MLTHKILYNHNNIIRRKWKHAIPITSSFPISLSSSSSSSRIIGSRIFSNSSGNVTAVNKADVNKVVRKGGFFSGGKSSKMRNVVVGGAFMASMGMSYLLGLSHGNAAADAKHEHHHHSHSHRERVLPSGVPRACCDCEEAPIAAAQLINKLNDIVGADNVLRKQDAAVYCKGARLGQGEALCVVRPGTLSEAVACLRAIVEEGCTVLPQGANTGLTGGSVPRNDEADDRPAVVINMRRLNGIIPMDDGEKMFCFAGAGISDVNKKAVPYGREGHSVLGSIFLNPSVAAGVAFGSGGTQLRKGPAYTDRALFCKVSADGKNVEIVNKLGIMLNGIDLEIFEEKELLTSLSGNLKEGVISTNENSKSGKELASDRNYPKKVCTLDQNVTRFNADTSGSEVNRSEGKLLILASIHDTFPKAVHSNSFWISCDSFDTALNLRKEVCLASSEDLPTSCEYMDRDSFDIIDRSGRILCLIINLFGVGEVVGNLWNIKLKIESFRGMELFCDKALHIFNNMFPSALSSALMTMGYAFDHHLILEVGEYGNGSQERLIKRLNDFVSKQPQGSVLVHELSLRESSTVKAFRFAAAPAFKTWCVGENTQGLSVDYALPKNGGFAPSLEMLPIKRMRYSHFGCNVVHEDLAYGLDVDVHEAKMQIKRAVQNDGGRLPAEHGHGTEYKAPAETLIRWKKMDPSNTMNPGIGGLPSSKYYK